MTCRMRDIDLFRLAKDSGGHKSDLTVAGQSAQKVVWDFALTNEAVLATSGSTISWQGDLDKCYELVPFSAIMEEARATGFPPVLVKLERK